MGICTDIWAASLKIRQRHRLPMIDNVRHRQASEFVFSATSHDARCDAEKVSVIAGAGVQPDALTVCSASGPGHLFSLATAAAFSIKLRIVSSSVKMAMVGVAVLYSVDYQFKQSKVIARVPRVVPVAAFCYRHRNK